MLRFLSFLSALFCTSARQSVAIVVLLGLGVLGGPTAHAQTPVTTVENGEGDPRLELFHNGGFLVPGTIVDDGTETDSIPAEGGGVRMMWYPEKAAFRAGEASDFNGEWDAANVGAHSAAFGKYTKAGGPSATAMGNRTTAGADNATAMGYSSEARGDNATAMGYFATADADNATAMGYETFAGGPYSTAMGRGTNASDENATAMGYQTNATAPYSTAMGRGTSASGESATAMGTGAEASAYAATAMGIFTTATRTGATAMGTETTASGSRATAMGVRTKASGVGATAMGNSTEAATRYSLSIGECNSANTSADNTIFVAGNGTYGKDCSHSDALVLEDDGDLEITGSLTESSDRRLKTDIAPLEEGTLDALVDIRPVRFQFKDETTHPSGEQIGILAQEVREVFPELVTEGSDGMLSVAYPKLSAVLLKGVQEQQATIEEKETRIDELEKRMDDVNDRVAELEAQSGNSLPAGLSASGLAVGFLFGGLFGAGLLWRRRQG